LGGDNGRKVQKVRNNGFNWIDHTKISESRCGLSIVNIGGERAEFRGRKGEFEIKEEDTEACLCKFKNNRGKVEWGGWEIVTYLRRHGKE
jgi:hypothetical protein